MEIFRKLQLFWLIFLESFSYLLYHSWIESRYTDNRNFVYPLWRDDDKWIAWTSIKRGFSLLLHGGSNWKLAAVAEWQYGEIRFYDMDLWCFARHQTTMTKPTGNLLRGYEQYRFANTNCYRFLVIFFSGTISTTVLDNLGNGKLLTSFIP